jgi:ribosomal protein S27E
MSSQRGTRLEHRFSGSELELCPDCGNEQLLPPSPTALMRVCLECGVVPKPAGATMKRRKRPKVEPLTPAA